MPITIHDVAAVAGVSIATVSRVLNDNGHPVSDGTRLRVLAAVEELGYWPNQAARSLRTDRSATVAVIADDIASPFTPIIIRGIQDYMRKAGYLCVAVNADWDPEMELSAIHDLVSRAIDGVVFAETWHQAANELLDIANKPYVFVHRQFAAAHQYSVTPDEIYGARLAVGHLVRLGHRRIGYVSGPEHYYASQDRFAGYRIELEDAGVAVDPSLVAVGDWEMESGYAAMQSLLRQTPRPTAVFAGNDTMAVGAIYAIQDAGLRVPEDVAVVGYDDIEISAIFRPALTTVTLPCYEMGAASAQMLLDLLEDRAAGSEEVKIKGNLIVRASCGANVERTQRDRLVASHPPA